MRNASNEEPNLKENKNASITPIELHPIKEFISLSKIRLNKYQSSSNYLYFRSLGNNIYQALSYIYIEEILKCAEIAFIASFIEKIKCEESSLFKTPLFLSKMQKETLNLQELYQKSEDSFIKIFEKYLDSLLRDEKTNRLNLVYDFYWHCMNSEEIRRFCSILLRKMVSYFSYEFLEVCKKLVKNSNLKILYLEEENFSKDDLHLISYSINFRIDVFQAIKDAEMKQEMFEVIQKKEAFSRLTLIIYNNKFFNFYNNAEKPELQDIINRFYEKKKGVSEENRKEICLNEVKKAENSYGNDQMEIENEHNNNIESYKEEKVQIGEKIYDFIEINEEEKMEKNGEKSKQIENKKNKEELFQEKSKEIKKYYNELKKNRENSENIKEINKNIDYTFETSKKIKINDEINLNPPSSSFNPLKSNENSSEKLLDSFKNKEIKEFCNKCKKNLHEKPLFTLKSCGHKICFDCMIKEYYPYAGTFDYKQICPYSQCRKSIQISEIENYFQMISLLESQIENSSKIEEKDEEENEKKLVYEEIENYFELIPKINENNPENNQNNENISDDTVILENSSSPIIPEIEPNPQNSQNKNLIDIEKEPNPLNLMEPKINCVICLKPTPQTRVFSNPTCLHCYCRTCVETKLESLSGYSFCSMKNCFQIILRKSLENYLLESNEFNQNLGENKQKIIKQICYNCKKENTIKISPHNEIDIFQCNFCYKTSCLLHKAPLVNCYCFCESCNIKTESDLIHPTRKICVNCRNKYCNLCRSSLVKCRCYCKKCDEIMKNLEENNEIMQNEDLKMEDKFCGNCRKNCFICGNILLPHKEIVNEKCGHFFCRECMFENLNRFKKTQCAVKHNYY